MKDLIKKILREGMQISDDAPDWVKEFHTLPREGRIEMIKKNKRQIEKLLPRIIEFFKYKFGDNLVQLKVINEEGVRGRYYGNESYTTNAVLLQFFFHNRTPNVTTLKKEVMNDLKSFFNIHWDYYGMPIDLEFFKAVYEKF
jgi:hypothetical protein